MWYLFQRMKRYITTSRILRNRTEFRNEYGFWINGKEVFDDIERMFENYIICGDLNSKSFVFNCKSENSNGNILEDIIINNNCQIINDGIFSPTFHTVTANKNYHELLDFFVGSPIFGGNLEESSK